MFFFAGETWVVVDVVMLCMLDLWRQVFCEWMMCGVVGNFVVRA